MYKKPIISIDFINIKLINITNCDKKLILPDGYKHCH